MEYQFTSLAGRAALVVEAVGVLVILSAAAWALFNGARRMLRPENSENAFRDVRHRLGRGILLGLEFLVAGDIIHTVAVDLSFATVSVLGLIVLIRTFLSFALEVEITGRWPWQSKRNRTDSAGSKAPGHSDKEL